MKQVTIGILIFIVSMAGCASTPALRTESSTSSIRAAEEVGAREVPRAAFHLQLAKEELARAQDLSERGDEERAASLLRRAEADAELAILLSKEENQKSEAAEAMARVRRLLNDNR